MEKEQFLAKWLQMEDVLGRRPEADPYVFVSRSQITTKHIAAFQGKFCTYTGVKSFLIDQKHKADYAGKVQFDQIHGSARDYFDENGRYVFDESFEDSGVILEPITRRISFEGLSLTYSEPTERLQKYLRLHRSGADRKWINPWTDEVIIKTGDPTSSWDDHDEFMSVRRSELLDYLAARQKGLLVLRYADQRLDSDLVFNGLPKDKEGTTPFGRWTQFTGESHFQSKQLYMRRSWESFWIDPPAEPKRRDGRRKDARDAVTYTLSDGEKGTFREEKDFFRSVSFNSHGVMSLGKKLNHSIEYDSLTTFTLKFPEGDYIHGSINLAGQFQAWLGDLAKQDKTIQDQLAPISEPESARLSKDFIDAQIYAEFPSSRPVAWTLSQVLRDLNQSWSDTFGEVLLLSPKEEELTDPVGPSSGDPEELADYAMTLRKAIVPEGKIETIKAKINFESKAPSPQAYKEIRSIAYLRILFKEITNDDSPVRALGIINDLRQAKGHPKKIKEEVKHIGFKADTYRKNYFEMLILLIDFIIEFRGVTEKVLGAKLGEDEDSEEAWNQIDSLRSYCESVIEY